GAAKPVAGAYVTVTLIKGDPRNGTASVTDVLTTDDAGTVRTLISADHAMSICAEKKEYERVCEGPKRFTDREVNIVLKRSATVFNGKLLTEQRANGRLTWVNAAGVVTEETHVTTEGDFTYLRPHPADDYLVYLSPFHPLTVFSGLVWREGETLEIPLPPAIPFQSAVHLSDACSQES